MDKKQLTGYLSIDKPWLKYYSEEAINVHIFADMLVRRQEDIRYDLISYLRENMKYAR